MWSMGYRAFFRHFSARTLKVIVSSGDPENLISEDGSSHEKVTHGCGLSLDAKEYKIDWCRDIFKENVFVWQWCRRCYSVIWGRK